MTRRTAALAGLLLAATWVGCEEGTPVAPSGAILRISASPTRISKSGTSNITVVVSRSNGNPVNPGTEVRLSTSLGTVDPVVATDDAGIAHAILRGDGRQVGTATVTAFSGASEPVTLDVAVGQLAAALRFQVDPSSIPETGGTLELLALVTDDQSQPLADAQVNFRSEVGSLASGGRFLVTNSRGEARDRLSVSAADIQTIGGDSFEVVAETGGSGGSIISSTFTVSIQRAPQASFTFQVVGLSVAFQDTSTGGPTAWTWDFGDGTPNSTQRNPVHTYSGPGSYLVTLTVRNSSGTDTAASVVQITQ
jgi:hypothetical protein